MPRHGLSARDEGALAVLVAALHLAWIPAGMSSTELLVAHQVAIGLAWVGLAMARHHYPYLPAFDALGWDRWLLERQLTGTVRDESPRDPGEARHPVSVQPALAAAGCSSLSRSDPGNSSVG